MDAYDPALAPAGFGLINTGAICYFNSFLQALASCTALTRAALGGAEYLGQTRTGAAFLAYVRAYSAGPVAQGIEHHSAAVLSALVADLAVRKPHVRFGGGQESASEALVHLLDMMEPPPEKGADVGIQAAATCSSPLTRLFLHRFRCDLHCRACKQVVSNETDYAVSFHLFHLDAMRTKPATVADFSKAVRLQVSTAEGYLCPKCNDKTQALRVYNLTMVPELIVCAFNLYEGFGGARLARYFPGSLEFPAIDGGKLIFRLTAQVEHAGGLSGGHYWARALRAGGRVHLLNDTSVTPSVFAPTPYTYLVVYHYAGREPAPTPTENGVPCDKMP